MSENSYNIIKQYILFKKKHYYKAKDINTIEYYKNCYKFLPKIISTFLNEIKFNNFKILYTNSQNELVTESKTTLPMNILITRNNTWLSGLFKVQIIFSKINDEYYPVHLIDIII